MTEITPPKDLYYNLLPKQIKSKVFQNIPYPDILFKCEEFCDSEEFWVRKAAHDTGNEYTKEFEAFFNEEMYYFNTFRNRYLRVLAYNNIAVPGE